MLDDKAPRSKLGPASRGSSFYIENLLRTTERGASAEERVETPGFKVTVHSPIICPGLEAQCLNDSDAPNRTGTSPNTARSECIYQYFTIDKVSRKAKRSRTE